MNALISWGMITAPRAVSTIGQSLDSFFETFRHPTPEVHIFKEPGCNNYLNQNRVTEHVNESTLGCVHNWLTSATWMLHNTQSAFVCMLEDDIIWNEDSSDKVTRCLKTLSGEIRNEIVYRYQLVDKIGFISPYCSKQNGSPISERGWRKPLLERRSSTDGKNKRFGWCGCLALIMPRKSLALLLAEQEYLIKRATENTRKQSYARDLDFAIGETFHKLDLIMLAHMPTLVQHIGDVSTHASNNVPGVEDYKSRHPNL